MKTDYLEKGLFPTENFAKHSLSVDADLLNDLRTGDFDQENRISYWQLIFLQSRANGCLYSFGDLPQVKWQWPKDTWFQARLSQKLSKIELAA